MFDLALSDNRNLACLRCIMRRLDLVRRQTLPAFHATHFVKIAWLFDQIVSVSRNVKILGQCWPPRRGFQMIAEKVIGTR